MSVLEAALGGHRVVVEVPRNGIEDWVAVAEVLLQEGLRAWVLPPELFSLGPQIVAVFGRRARIGACGVTDPDGVRAAVDAGLSYILSPVHDPALAEAAGGVPLLFGALTPSEVADVVHAGHDTVLVTPVDTLGSSYSRFLPAQFPRAAIVPWGRLERYQCEMWLEAGAAAVVVSEVVLRPEDGAGINAVDEVGRRAASFRQLLGN